MQQKRNRTTAYIVLGYSAILFGCGDGQSSSLSQFTITKNGFHAQNRTFLTQIFEENDSSSVARTNRHLVVTNYSTQTLLETLSILRGNQSLISLAATTEIREYSNTGVVALNISQQEAQYLEQIGIALSAKPSHAVHKLLTQQQPPSWGIDRIDGSAYGLDKKYVYPENSGKGVYAYIIDSGIDSHHPEFQDRVLPGFNAVQDNKGTFDCDGHGTHVAGTVGGIFSGVAKKVSLVPVRVLDCTGNGKDEDVVAAMEWIIAQKKANPKIPIVANLSLGGKNLPALDTAATHMVELGIFVAAAAGNDGEDACEMSPARAPGVMAVGASDRNDFAADYSNFGKCVHIYAPGDEIYSAKANSRTGTIMSGTSMASPHVAGAAAIVLGIFPQYSAEQVESEIKTKALKGTLKNVTEANLLLQIEPGEDKPDPGQPPPPFPGLILRYEADLPRGGKKTFYPNTATLKGKIRITANLKSADAFALQTVSLYKWNEKSAQFQKVQKLGNNANKLPEWLVENGRFTWEVQSNSGASAFELETRYLEEQSAF